MNVAYRRRRRSDSGFTLFEVVVAISLCGVLMAGVYRALGTTQQLLVAGQETARCDQIARAFFAMVERTLEAAQDDSRPAPAETLPWDESSELKPAGLVSIRRAPKSPCGIIGDAKTLLIFENADAVLAGSSQFVAFTMAQRGGIRPPVQLTDTNFSAALRPTDSGIVRAAGAMPSHTVSATDSTRFDKVELLADEGSWLGFRYFDGVAWRDQWDARQGPAMPVAIEIELRLRLTAAPYLSQRKSPRGEKAYRFIVARPLAKTNVVGQKASPLASGGFQP
jgi:prepilin-type N-terminal cleavage/methylation domain-containing protein